MLYEVGIDALDSLESATSVNVYLYQRNYANIVIFNLEVPRSNRRRFAVN